MNMSHRLFLNGKINERLALKIYVMALSFSFLCYLFVNYVGEEGIYVWQATQILYHQQWFNMAYARPPMFAWMIIALSHVIGYTHMLLAARIVCIGSFLVMAHQLYRCIKNQEGQSLLAWYVLSSLYTVAVVVKLVWLSYADSTFAMFSVLSVLWLYESVTKDKKLFFFLSLLALAAALLTKSVIVLLLYGSAFCLLFFVYPQRRSWFYSLTNAAVYVIGLVGVALFFYKYPAYWHRMLFDVTDGTFSSSWSFYLHKVLLTVPFNMLCYATAPAFSAAIYALCRRRVDLSVLFKSKLLRVFALVWVINFLPLWLTSRDFERRYLLPLFPFMAVFAGYVIFNGQAAFRQAYCKFLLVVMCVICSTATWAYYVIHPYNYQAMARSVNAIVGAHDLYISSLSVSTTDSMNASIASYRYAHGLSNTQFYRPGVKGYYLSHDLLSGKKILHDFSSYRMHHGEKQVVEGVYLYHLRQ